MFVPFYYTNERKYQQFSSFHLSNHSLQYVPGLESYNTKCCFSDKTSSLSTHISFSFTDPFHEKQLQQEVTTALFSSTQANN